MKAGDSFALRCEVDDRVYHGFIALFGDRNPLHTDAEFARAKGFAGPVMHGNILGGFLSRLVGEVLPMKDVMIQSETINFRRPVFLGDVLELTAKIDEIYESVGSAELTFAFANEKGQRVATGTILIGLLQ